MTTDSTTDLTTDFPYRVDGRGRTATTGRGDHVRDLIEQVLLTAPGERVMRPTFGSGLLDLVFEPGGADVAAATQFLVQGALEQYLADVIAVQSLTVEAVEPSLVVTVSYVVLETRTAEVATFTAPGAGA